MMRKSKSILAFLIIFMIFSFCLAGCSDNKTNTEDIKSKVIQELDYLDDKIVDIANRLSNITLQNYTITSEEVSLNQNSDSNQQSENSSGEDSSSQEGQSGDSQKQSNSQGQTESSNVTTTQMESNTILDSNENDIDWKTIKSEIETVSDSWGVVILDLSNLNVDNNDILSFSTTLDDCILSIKNENKADTLTNIAKLYSYIPKFERGISAENSIQNIKQVKSYIINAYSLVEKDDWTTIGTNISDCENTFKNLINDMEYMKDKEYKVNKTYVVLKELQNSLTYKDKKLFYVKYKNVMESINTL